MNMKRRLERLEGGGSSARACPECGVALWGAIMFTVLLEGDERTSEECSACGRSWPFTFSIERAAPGAEGGGGNSY